MTVARKLAARGRGRCRTSGKDGVGARRVVPWPAQRSKAAAVRLCLRASAIMYGRTRGRGPAALASSPGGATMKDTSAANNEIHAGSSRALRHLAEFLPLSSGAPELIQQLWGFAKAGYLDNPMPSVFKERCLSGYPASVRCATASSVMLDFSWAIVTAAPQETRLPSRKRSTRLSSCFGAVSLAARDGRGLFASGELTAPIDTWPDTRHRTGRRDLRLCSGRFVEPARSERARRALVHAVGFRRFEFFSGCWPSSERRTTGRCCIRRSRPKTTCGY
jgi:hypothetical protein